MTDNEDNKIIDIKTTVIKPGEEGEKQIEDMFEEAKRKNREKAEKLKEERRKHNEKVKRQYNLKK